MYEISDIGILASAVISVTLLFVAFCHVSHVKKSGGDHWQVLGLITLAYFFLWLFAILIGQSVFNINLTKRLSTISMFSILLPYFGNLVYYFYFRHPPINVFGPVMNNLKRIF